MPAVKGQADTGSPSDPAWALAEWDWAAAAVLQVKPPRMPCTLQELGGDESDQGTGTGSDDGWQDMPAFETFVSQTHSRELEDTCTAAAVDAEIELATKKLTASIAPSPPSSNQHVPVGSSSMTQEEAKHVHQLETRQALLEGKVSSIGKQLESRERAMEVVMNLVPQMICSKDAEGKYIIANKKMAALYGMSPSELEGKNQLDVAKSAAEARAMLKVDQQVIAAGRENVNIIVLKQEFGGTRLVPKTMKITKFPYVQPENGEPAVMAIGEDISEYIEKEKRVKEKLETLQLANGKLKTEKAMLEHKCKMYQGLNCADNYKVNKRFYVE
jgi:PAS domain S-box-containing protein